MLSSEHSQAVRDLVVAALRCEPATRADFIREASHGDVGLSDDALTLLQQVLDQEAGGAPIEDTRLLLSSTGSFDPPALHQSSNAQEFRGNARFEVRRKLGAGGFGEVYEAYDGELRQSVALKVLRRADPAVLFRFKREFRALVDIRHPNLIELYELFCDDQLWFFTMELVHGVNFLSHVEQRPRSAVAGERMACDVGRLRDALLQLSEGIAALHARGILHRDIKPANVMVSAAGRVKLLDFGLVRETESSSMQSVMVAGTPAYMSPERFALLPSDTPSDWFSVGVMLYQALTGTVPSRGFDRQAAASHLARLRDVPPDLEQLCLSLLHPEPAKRPNGTEVRERLGAPTPPHEDVPIADPEEPLVGREPQLAALARLVELTRQGRAVVVNLYGPSGIGKSTVLRTFRRRLARSERDVVVLMGHCHENETVPFKALDDLIDHLSQYLNGLQPGELDALAPRDATSLIRVFPILAHVGGVGHRKRASLDIVDAQELRRRAFASLQDLLARLAERKTVVLAIDDVQWGDLDSAAFLRALFVAPSPPGLLLIASYRAEDAETSPFLKTWRAHLATTDSFIVENVPLGELTPDESEQLASRLMPQAGSGTLETARAIARESGGSPFLIEQFARYTTPDAIDPAGLSIRRAIELRLAEMPAPARRFLETLAIAAQPISESVALAAAEFEAANRPAISRLAADHFVRVRETADSRQLEIYHDRLRRMIVASIPPETLQRRHLDLALALKALPSVDPATLSIHHRESGDLERASHYALAAADQARNALAFERAAEWYAAALEYGTWNRDEAITLRRKLAEVLAFAGRGPSAADVYLKAAESAGHDSRAELQRLAAEQLLRAGHVDQGLDVLERTARELGIWIPSTRWQTLLSLAVHRLRAALPAFGLRPQASSRTAPRLIILDVYWSFFIGLGNFDPIRAMDFHSRHLVLAARVGDPKRRALSLAAEAVTRAVSGRESETIGKLIDEARTMCLGLHVPETLGFIATMEAMCVVMTGNWRQALRLGEQAERFLSEECSGVAWERATSTQARATGVFHLGEWAAEYDSVQRFPAAIVEAKARGDVHAMVANVPAGTLAFLVADEPSLAEEFIRDTIAALPRTRFLMPNVWVFALKVYIALYMGDGEKAWNIVDSEWSALSASQFLRVEYMAVAALDVRARAAIALTVGGHSTRRLGEARRCARQLARKHSRWAHAVSFLIRAGVASVEQQFTTAVDLLERAESEFRAADMAHYVAACRYRRGTIVGGEDGRALVSAADAWARSQGIAQPAKIFDMLAPGRWEPAGIH